MLRFLLLAATALPLAHAALAQTAPKQVTEVTEDLDPKTGKVIRRTTRTTTEPAGTGAATGPTMASTAPATDAVVSDFFREKMVVTRLDNRDLVGAYQRFIEKVRDERRGWQPADWTTAASVLSSLNARYEQLRNTFVLDDKVTIRSIQGEFQALRTARAVTDQVSNKL